MANSQVTETQATTTEPAAIVQTLHAEASAPALEDLIVAKAKESGVNAHTAIKIAKCESTLRQFSKDGQALRGLHNPDDVGLFQINEQYHLEKSKELGYDIHTTEGNIDYAMWLMKNQGIYHWKWSQPCWGTQ